MLRSLLFVPATEKMIGKINSLSADAFIIDLEDSIAPDDKDTAIDIIVDTLPSIVKQNIYVRLNKERYQVEFEKLKEFENIGFMLPKFEDTSYYEKNQDLFCRKIIALVESPIGLNNIEAIASCSWVDAVAFGAEDYTSSIGMVNDNKYLIYQKSVIINACKAYDKQAYDTPSFQLNDQQKLEEEICVSVDMGFDGKLAINPKHIDTINAAFDAYDENIIKEIIKQYEDSGKAVVVINGKPYEKMHINHFKKILKEKFSL